MIVFLPLYAALGRPNVDRSAFPPDLRAPRARRTINEDASGFIQRAGDASALPMLGQENHLGVAYDGCPKPRIRVDF